MRLLPILTQLIAALLVQWLCTGQLRAQATIHYLGASSHEAAPATTQLHPLARPVSNLLRSEQGTRILDTAVSQFLQAVADQSPASDIRIIAPDAEGATGRNVNDLVYATITLDPSDIVIIDNDITSTTRQHFTSIFIPLYLIRARDGTLLYARTQIINIPFESAMLTDNGQARARFYAALARAFDPANPRARVHIEEIAAALERGTFRSPTAVTYAIAPQDVAIKGDFAHGAHSFSDTAQVQRFFQKSVETQSARNFIVIASPAAQPTRKQIGDVAINSYNLQVFVDLSGRSDAAFERNGRYFLPLNLPAPDYRLGLELQLTVDEQQSHRFNRSGEYECRVTLSERLSHSSDVVSSETLLRRHPYTIAAQAKVTPRALQHMVALVYEQVGRKKE